MVGMKPPAPDDEYWADMERRWRRSDLNGDGAGILHRLLLVVVFLLCLYLVFR